MPSASITSCVDEQSSLLNVLAPLLLKVPAHDLGLESSYPCCCSTSSSSFGEVTRGPLIAHIPIATDHSAPHHTTYRNSQKIQPKHSKLLLLTLKLYPHRTPLKQCNLKRPRSTRKLQIQKQLIFFHHLHLSTTTLQHTHNSVSHRMQ